MNDSQLTVEMETPKRSLKVLSLTYSKLVSLSRTEVRKLGEGLLNMKGCQTLSWISFVARPPKKDISPFVPSSSRCII
jgi:hypothetical protein